MGEAASLSFANLSEFCEESGQLLKVLRIGDLTDEVRGANQARQGIRVCMRLVRWHRETGHLDTGSDQLDVDIVIPGKAFLNVHFPPVDVIRGHEGIGSTDGRLNPSTIRADQTTQFGVLGEERAQITNVVEQHSDHSLQPVSAAEVAYRKLSTPKNGLSCIGDEHRVLEVMIGTVALQQCFQRDLSCRFQRAELRLSHTRESLAVRISGVNYKGLYDRSIGIEHESSVGHGWGRWVALLLSFNTGVTGSGIMNTMHVTRSLVE